MEQIELFDRYINGELSNGEKKEFDERLKIDKNFSSEFRIYAATVIGICREANQDNKDFEEAMKRIPKEELLSIIGERKKGINPIRADKTPTFKRWLLWQGIGVAVLLGLGVIYVVIAKNEANSVRQNALASNQEAMDKVDNAIFAFSDYSQGITRGGGMDISKLSDKELKAQLPTMESKFREQIEDVDIVEFGSDLVMTYIRLHEREKAIKLLTELIERFQYNSDYEDDVINWKTILSLLQ